MVNVSVSGPDVVTRRAVRVEPVASILSQPVVEPPGELVAAVSARAMVRSAHEAAAVARTVATYHASAWRVARARLATPVGTMKGSYQMTAEDGVQFEAPIAEFVLSMPRILH